MALPVPILGYDEFAAVRSAIDPFGSVTEEALPNATMQSAAYLAVTQAWADGRIGSNVDASMFIDRIRSAAVLYMASLIVPMAVQLTARNVGDVRREYASRDLERTAQRLRMQAEEQIAGVSSDIEALIGRNIQPFTVFTRLPGGRGRN